MRSWSARCLGTSWVLRNCPYQWWSSNSHSVGCRKASLKGFCLKLLPHHFKWTIAYLEWKDGGGWKLHENQSLSSASCPGNSSSHPQLQRSKRRPSWELIALFHETLGFLFPFASSVLLRGGCGLFFWNCWPNSYKLSSSSWAFWKPWILSFLPPRLASAPKFWFRWRCSPFWREVFVQSESS